MNCDVCQRAHHPKRLPFLCVVDARNELYEGRIQDAKILIETTELESRVNQHLADAAATDTRKAPRTHVDNCASEASSARDRTEIIIQAADNLRNEVAAARKAIEERKAANARKKTDLEAVVSQGVATRRTRELEEASKASRMYRYTWDREYEAMTQYRAALCTEVARLYRLQRVRRGNPVRFEYRIGGIDIIDLHHMNSESLTSIPFPCSAQHLHLYLATIRLS
jgi:hypothetical protein